LELTCDRQPLPKFVDQQTHNVRQFVANCQQASVFPSLPLTRNPDVAYGSAIPDARRLTNSGHIRDSNLTTLSLYREVAMSHAPAFAAATLMLLLPGCALFHSNDDSTDSRTTARELFSKRTEKHDGPVLNAARLEASIVVRPANDERVRKHVWMELDESGLMAPDRRQSLNQHGFRVAVSSGTAPWDLQSSGTRSLCRDAVNGRSIATEHQPV
jgi:hypothetical protein